MDVNKNEFEEFDNKLKRMSIDEEEEEEQLSFKCYDLVLKTKGIALLISNKKFKDKDFNRFGAELDLERLEKCFNELDFKTEIRLDIKGDEIKKELEYFSKKDFSEISSFVCVIMSYGSAPANIYGVDGEKISFDKEAKKFFRKNASLVDKPKLFFLQACQEINTNILKDLNENKEIKLETFKSLKSKSSKKKYLESDFLFSYSNVEEYDSFVRDVKKGTWYIQALVYVLEKYADTLNVIKMLKKVNNKVMEKFELASTLESSLKYDFYFKPCKIKPNKNKRRISKLSIQESSLERNLLKNGDAEQKFDYWCLDDENSIKENLQDPEEFRQIVRKYDKECIMNSGELDWSKEWLNKIDGWSIENNQSHSFDKLKLKNKLMLNFVAGYFMKGKYQVIDLEKEGITEDFIIEFKPKIEIVENYTRRDDSGCDYILRVFLLSKDYELIDFFMINDKLNDYPCDWKCITHLFNCDDSKKSVRFIVFYHAGKDHKCWAGFYGTKITNSSVIIKYEK